jgi:hypothetical protein
MAHHRINKTEPFPSVKSEKQNTKLKEKKDTILKI